MSTAFLWGGPLRGVVDWRGQHVYLLAPAQLGASQNETAMLAVVGDQHGYLGLPIDAATTLRRFRPDQLSGAEDGALYAGLIVDDQASPIRLLDSTALLQLIPRTAKTTQQQCADSVLQRSRDALSGAIPASVWPCPSS
jgi:chemotaxis signal transduction protein